MISEKFEACILAGVIGDAWGSASENNVQTDTSGTYYWGGKKEHPERPWAITDDTQLTLATCEAICFASGLDMEVVAQYFVKYYKARRVTGVGSSTLKALLELEAGGHWSQVGRIGEYAAGNGAAMRIAPLAFINNVNREDVQNACRITHRNDEAYTGALAVFLAIRASIDGRWTGANNLIELIIPELPDTNVRDRLIAINNLSNSSSIVQVAEIGCSGYVADSIPLAIFAASKSNQLGLVAMFREVIAVGRDTDTNASIAGQIAGAALGLSRIPEELLTKLRQLKDYNWIATIIEQTKSFLAGR